MSTSTQLCAVATTENQKRASANDALLAGLGDQFGTQQYLYGPLELNTHTSNNNNGTCTNTFQQPMTCDNVNKNNDSKGTGRGTQHFLIDRRLNPTTASWYSDNCDYTTYWIAFGKSRYS